MPGRAPADLVEEREAGEDDPSVAEVFAPRLGHEVLDALVDPLIGGINASDVASLSFVACAPQLAAAARRTTEPHAALRAGRQPPRQRASRRPPSSTAFESGLATLTDALVADLVAQRRRSCARCNSRSLRRSRRRDGRWRSPAGETIVVDGVVLAFPAFAAATLLEDFDAELAAECAAIPYASVVTVTLAWPASAVPDDDRTAASTGGAVGLGAPASAAALPGSGVLVPRPAAPSDHRRDVHLDEVASFGERR